MLKDPVIQRGWIRSLLYLICMVLVIILFSIPAVAVSSLLTDGKPGEIFIYRENIFALVVFQGIILAGITLLTLFFSRYIDRRSLVSLGFGKFRVSRDLMLGLMLGVVIISAGFLILNLTDNLEIKSIKPDYSFLAGSLILCVFISWMEEISFRGYILNNLMDSFSPGAGLIISSLLFAGFHMLNPGMSFIPFINLFLAGILLGIVFIYTRTIWYALSLHFSWNFFQGPVFGFRVSGIELDGFIRQEVKGDEIISGGAFGFEGSILASFIIILCIFALNRYYNRITDNYN
jgi:uncharacterized protein